MDITYNNVTSATNIVTLTQVPNLLTISDASGGTKATITLEFSGNLSSTVTNDGQYYITILGETITNVISYNNIANKSFYISTGNTSTAASVTKALRNCPTIAANFIVVNDEATVTLTSRNYNSILSNAAFSTNISTTYLTADITDGESLSDLASSLVSVDVYASGEYVTSLEKTFYEGSLTFDMSPILSTVSEIGRTVPYYFKVSSIKNGQYTDLATTNTNYSTVGYMCNQGLKFIQLSGVTVAMNATRGNTKTSTNNTTLYIYKPSLPISIYVQGVSTVPVVINYLDSAYTVLHTYATTWRNPGQYAPTKLFNLEYELNEEWFNESTYVEITFNNYITYRFNVIKPLRASEHCQRILWRNSYGGVSFVDLTGELDISNDITRTTYEKNIFDYYTADVNSLEKTYKADVKTTYTIKSHLMDADGRWMYYDLMASPFVWTEINNEKYEIILDAVSVEEQNRNDIYKATVKFHISQPYTLI